MLRLLSILLFCYALPANACICNTMPLDESIKYYSFIARAKIIYEPQGIDTSLRIDKTWAPLSHSAIRTLQIIELFKGDSVKRIVEYDINTSCEVGLQPGEEWIVFAYYNADMKKYIVGACSPSMQLRNKEGEQGYLYWSGNRGTLQYLRKYFNHIPSEPKYDSGTFKSYYPDGRMEWEASYQNGELDGNRKVYFANGQLWQNENYKQGKKEGVYQRYKRTGQLLEEMNYVADKVRTAVYWHDTSYFERGLALLFDVSGTDKKKRDSALLANTPVIQKSVEAFFKPDGNYYSRRYHRTGWLEQEVFRNDSSGFSITCRYEKSGKLSFEGIVTKYNDHTTEKKWNDKGELISHKEWEKNSFLGEKINR